MHDPLEANVPIQKLGETIGSFLRILKNGWNNTRQAWHYTTIDGEWLYAYLVPAKESKLM